MMVALYALIGAVLLTLFVIGATAVMNYVIVYSAPLGLFAFLAVLSVALVTLHFYSRAV